MTLDPLDSPVVSGKESKGGRRHGETESHIYNKDDCYQKKNIFMGMI
jgi:hypothetical protein